MIIIMLIKRRKHQLFTFMRFEWFVVWTNLNLLYPGMLSAKFGWNWPSGSWEEICLISSMYVWYYAIISPLKMPWPYSWIPFTQWCIVPSLVEISPVVWEKKIFKFLVNVFSLFGKYLPSKMGGALYLKKLESSSPNYALCQVWLKLA